MTRAAAQVTARFDCARLSSFLFLGTAGCGFSGTSLDWSDQLVGSGPCYEANLLDGLDTTSTDEEHAVYDCLDAHGALDAFSGLDESLDAETRDGAVGIVLAVWLADATSDVDGESLGTLVSAAGDVLDDPTLVTDRLPTLFEVAYGVPFDWLGSSVDPATDPMTSGLLVPAMDLAGPVATQLLDDERWVSPAAAALRSDRTRSLLWTIAALPTATDATLRTLGEDWPDLFAQAVETCEDTSNDRWSGASESSLRDVAGALVAPGEGGAMTLDVVLASAAPLLQDEQTGERMRAMIQEQAAYGRLEALPAQVEWLASVDVDGGSLDGGEDSALTSLVRLLARGDQSVDCSIDLGLFDIDFALGNLSVSLLELLEQQDPDTIESGVDLLGSLLGVSLTDTILDSVADSGVCPAIDQQMVTDLRSIDRLGDPQVDELLRVLLAALTASDGHIDTLVAAVHTTWDAGLMPPVEGVLRDLGDTSLASTLTSTLGVLVDPDHHYNPADFPADVEPLSFTMLWTWLGELAEPSAPPLEDLAGPLALVVEQDATWTLVDNGAAVVGNPESGLRGILAELQPLLWDEPTLAWLDDLANGVEDPVARRRVGVLAECDVLRGAVVEPGAGPVPALAGWTLDGSLDTLIRTVQVLATLVPEST